MISLEPVTGPFVSGPPYRADPNAIESKTLFVALLVGLAHIVSGIAVLATPAALNATQISSLAWLAESLGYTRGGFAAAVLIFTGAMAVIGSSTRVVLRKQVHVALFAPQELLLLLQIWAISLALVTGHYADGYSPTGGAWFILSDQIWSFVLAVSHSAYLAAFIYRGARSGRTGTDGGTS